MQSFWLWLDRNLLGYGEHVGRAAAGSCVLLLTIAALQFALTLDISKSFADAMLHLWNSIQYILFLLLDMPGTGPQSPFVLAVFVILLRYFLIGLLVAALFRLLSHR